MSIVRSLESFSLTELFKSIEDESRSGRLIIETPISRTTAKREGIYYVWFNRGNLIAVSDCLNRKGLINLIDARGWMSPLIVSRLRVLCPANEPLGVYLRKMKLLSKEKLSFAFQLQLHQVYRLFQLTSGRFRFDDFSEREDGVLSMPWLEMTGQQIATTEVTMYALRLIDSWVEFARQLPEPSTILQRSLAQPHLKLTALERQLWELADGKSSLLAVSRVLEQPIDLVRITAFRLLAVGLLSNIYQYSYDWNQINALSTPTKINVDDRLADAPQGSKTLSLLQNWGGILKRKISEN